MQLVQQEQLANLHTRYGSTLETWAASRTSSTLWSDSKDRKARRVRKVLKASKVLPVLKALRVLRVQLELKGRRVSRDRKARLVHKGRRGRRVPPARLVRLVQPDRREKQGQPVHKDHKGLKDLQEQTRTWTSYTLLIHPSARRPLPSPSLLMSAARRW